MCLELLRNKEIHRERADEVANAPFGLNISGESGGFTCERVVDGKVIRYHH